MFKPNASPNELFKDELAREIKKRKKYEGWDFKLAHFFIWLSILASFSSSIIIAAGDIKIDKIWVAIIAGIPGLVVVVEKTFEFARRTAWDTMYKIDMQELKDDLDFEKIDVYTAAKKLREITRRNESAFLKIGFFSQAKKDKLLTEDIDESKNKHLKKEDLKESKDDLETGIKND